MAGPHWYAIEVRYWLARPREEWRDIGACHLDREEARTLAESYRGRGFPVRVLAFPAVPYSVPFVPIVVEG